MLVLINYRRAKVFPAQNTNESLQKPTFIHFIAVSRLRDYLVSNRDLTQLPLRLEREQYRRFCRDVIIFKAGCLALLGPSLIQPRRVLASYAWRIGFNGALY